MTVDRGEAAVPSTVRGRPVGGEAGGAGGVADATQPDRFGGLDQGSEQAFALRQVADGGDHVGGHPGVDELGQVPVGGDHADRGVTGADQVTGGFDDVAQQHGQRQVTADQLVGVQQTAQPALGGQHLLRALDDLLQQLVEFQA